MQWQQEMGVGQYEQKCRPMQTNVKTNASCQRIKININLLPTTHHSSIPV